MAASGSTAISKRGGRHRRHIRRWSNGKRTGWTAEARAMATETPEKWSIDAHAVCAEL